MAYVTNDGIRIHYALEGEGTPLVLHHGLADTLDGWRDVGGRSAPRRAPARARRRARPRRERAPARARRVRRRLAIRFRRAGVASVLSSRRSLAS